MTKGATFPSAKRVTATPTRRRFAWIRNLFYSPGGLDAPSETPWRAPRPQLSRVDKRSQRRHLPTLFVFDYVDLRWQQLVAIVVDLLPADLRLVAGVGCRHGSRTLSRPLDHSSLASRFGNIKCQVKVFTLRRPPRTRNRWLAGVCDAFALTADVIDDGAAAGTWCWLFCLLPFRMLLHRSPSRGKAAFLNPTINPTRLA